MKFKQSLPIFLAICAVIVCNVLKSYADDETTAKQTAVSHQGSVDTNLKIFISPGQRRNWPGDPIVINITLKNAGKADVPLESTQPLFDYQVEVVRPDGTKAAITPEGKQMLERLGMSQSSVSGVIKVGEEGHNKLTKLTQIYDMKQEGVYQITLSRMVPKRADPNEGALNRYRYKRISPANWDELASVPHSDNNSAKSKEKAIADADSGNGFVKITSNTIRIGIGQIPDGALDEKPAKKAAPAKTGKAKAAPPAKPKAKK